MKTKLFLLLLLLFFVPNAYSKPTSYQGRHFLIGFMQNEIPRPEVDHTYHSSIFISTSQPDTITIHIPGLPIIETFVGPNQIYSLEIDSTFEIKNYGLNINKLIRVRSQHPIVC